MCAVNYWCWYDIHTYIYRYQIQYTDMSKCSVYNVEPKRPLFWMVDPQFYGSKPFKTRVIWVSYTNIHIYIYVYLGVSINGGSPIAGWFTTEDPSKMDDFGSTPISGNPNLYLHFSVDA